MQIEITRTDECKRKLNIVIPQDEVSKELSKIYQEINQKANIRGFRKGKVPRKVLEQYYKRDAEADLIQKIVPKACDEAANKENLKMVGGYLLEEYVLKDGEPLKLDISIEVKPDIVLKNYKGIEVQKKAVEVSDEDVDNVLKQTQYENAELKGIDTRGAEKNDEIVIDFRGRIDGKFFKGGEGKDFRLILGQGRMIEGFEEKLIGLRAGDKKEIDIQYPQNFPDEKLAGRKIIFEVLVKDVKERILPSIDDEFAKDLGDFNDLNALRNKIRDDLTKAKENLNNLDYEKEILEKLLEENAFVPPESLVKRELEFLKKNLAMRLSKGKTEELSLGKEGEEIMQEMSKEANKRVKESLILEKIAEEEKIEISNSEVDEDIRKRAEDSNQNFYALKEIFQKNRVYEAIRDKIREEKVLKFLLECSIIQ